MDSSHFDQLARSLAACSRRGLLAGLAGAIGLAAVADPDATAGKRKKKLVRNQYGCVDVGKACRGDDANCCSGICQGKKPKKGRPDSSRCVAHHQSGCPAGQDNCTMNPLPCANGTGECYQTTGNGSFCATPAGYDCRSCSRDADCQAEFGAGAACVVCTLGGACAQTQDRMCLLPAA